MNRDEARRVAVMLTCTCRTPAPYRFGTGAPVCGLCLRSIYHGDVVGLIADVLAYARDEQ